MLSTDRGTANPDAAVSEGYAQDVTLSAHDVAAEIRRRSPGTGVKKLHKLLYYCQAHHLAHTGSPLFRESVSAWDMGPVIGRLWHDEKNQEPVAIGAEIDESELNTVGYVLSRYGRLSARDLENMTHAEAPWRRADEGRAPGGSAPIRTDWLIEYFRSADDADDATAHVDVATSRTFTEGADERRARPARFDTAAGILARSSGHVQ